MNSRRDQAQAEYRPEGEMTPNEAATFLNVSRGFVMKLLDEGQLPF